MVKDTLYCVIWRTGGTENFVWHRSLAMTRDEAIEAAKETRAKGYHAFYVNYEQSMAIGLPETYGKE